MTNSNGKAWITSHDDGSVHLSVVERSGSGGAFWYQSRVDALKYVQSAGYELVHPPSVRQSGDAFDGVRA